MSSQLNLCRVCLKTDKQNTFVKICVKSSKITLTIKKISGVEVNGYKDFPAVICRQCITDVDAAEQLRKKLIKADKHFKAITKHITSDSKEVFVDPRKDVITDKELSVHSRINERERPRKARSLKEKDEDKRFLCSKCFKSFSDSNYLQKHEYFKHTEIPIENLYSCDVCGLKTKTKQLVRNHINTVHSEAPKEKFICRVCGKMLSTKGNLDVHEKIHVDLDPSDYIKCTVCGKPFKSRRFMLEHRKLVHDKSKMFSCPSCQHVSTCKGAFNIHFKSVHLKLKDFHCPDCGMGFCSNSQLTRHFRIHTGERPYECSLCSKPFRLSTHKNRHEKICPKRTIQ